MLLVSFEDLTEENLTTIFKEHFDSKALSVSVKEGAKEFTGVNDQFQSEIRKLKVKYLSSLYFTFLYYSLRLAYSWASENVIISTEANGCATLQHIWVSSAGTLQQ